MWSLEAAAGVLRMGGDQSWSTTKPFRDTVTAQVRPYKSRLCPWERWTDPRRKTERLHWFGFIFLGNCTKTKQNKTENLSSLRTLWHESFSCKRGTPALFCYKELGCKPHSLCHPLYLSLSILLLLLATSDTQFSCLHFYIAFQWTYFSPQALFSVSLQMCGLNAFSKHLSLPKWGTNRSPEQGIKPTKCTGHSGWILMAMGKRVGAAF